ncbi:MAG: class I SAM-dependent methyltransferase [Vicinamibacteria bacterium]|nr:class I SAM-dependent methyltransferase [Vicinamibacteria bacterium]
MLFNSPLRVSEKDAADFMASTDRFDHYGQIVRCHGCGLVYANPRPVPRQLQEGYARTEDADYAREASSRSINAHISLHTIKKFKERGRLLDVGCATGYFLNAARLSFEPCGVEPSRWAGRFAREVLSIDVQQGSLEEADLQDDWFDVVTMNDVIEHLTDPRSCLEKARRLLHAQGLLYIVTPNIASLSARLLRGRWWGLRPAHLYYFSPKTLKAMLAETGFETVFEKSFGRIFTYAYWASRLSNYPRPISAAARTLVRRLKIEDKFLYLDTRDTIELCALKK